MLYIQSQRKASIPTGTHTTPSMYTTTLDGHTIIYVVKHSKKARLARLEIAPDTGLIVIVPSSYGTERIQNILKNKSRWILNKLNHVHLTKHSRTNKLKDGDAIPYLGNFLKLTIRECDGFGESVTLVQDKLIVALRPGITGLNQIVEQWYRVRARQILKEKIERYAKLMVVDYNRIYLKGQKTVWGSCSRKHNLNFNWRLLMTPESIIDYVVVHELAHMKEMNHSKKFWQIVAGYCPEWQQRRKWLRENTMKLNKFLRV